MENTHSNLLRVYGKARWTEKPEKCMIVTEDTRETLDKWLKNGDIDILVDGGKMTGFKKILSYDHSFLWLLRPASLSINPEQPLRFLSILADLISLEEAAKILLGDARNPSTMRSNSAAKVRRLYDIANVLSSMNFIDTRKLAFRWLGMRGKLEEGSANSFVSKESKKRIFGTEIRNAIFKRTKLMVNHQYSQFRVSSPSEAFQTTPLVVVITSRPLSWPLIFKLILGLCLRIQKTRCSRGTLMASGHTLLVGINEGQWSSGSRSSYNIRDTISRSTVQVYPNLWIAVYMPFGQCGNVEHKICTRGLIVFRSTLKIVVAMFDQSALERERERETFGVGYGVTKEVLADGGVGRPVAVTSSGGELGWSPLSFPLSLCVE
ncbi:hypothetical protein Vadar_030924 [Vaccinium darrowii]|uniref:Uncharacterized protein n=1 Tax=Vaccinium darrowii TaxID=229202 RepID=A0ACB7ZFM8_9ERIC|nr:hypothetical protein Vadar_030924 [Vaccinium darrowii]